MEKKYHFTILAITTLITIWSAFMMPKVNVNSDMTKYLPDKSQMKRGLEIMEAEFDASQLANADVKVMFSDLSVEDVKKVELELVNIEDVKDVKYVIGSDSTHILYNLVVPKSVDQKSLGASIKEKYSNNTIIVETSQDGATPPVSVIIIAAAIILLILLVMAQSWLDPIVFLLSIGAAVVINVGTNALLPSVSITTNYIGSILQLVLSLDYAIVLMNRYRQEIREGRSTCKSINIAIKRAYPSILSSALTTVIGLVMLAFMRLKIGLDMGIVLAKGVIWSLVCTFSVLPSLILIFDKAIKKTSKRTFFIPTDRMGRFATSHKIPLTIFSAVLFVASFFLAKKTEIYFSTNGESQIEKFFPKSNPFVVIYDTRDDKNIIPMADSIGENSNIQAIISYPTLLQKQYTADGLTKFIQRLSLEMADYMPEIEQSYHSVLTPEMMRIAYYIRSGAGDTLSATFPELIWFVKNNCIDNPLFASMITDDMREQIGMLDDIVKMPQDDQFVETKPEKNEAKKKTDTDKKDAPKTENSTIANAKEKDLAKDSISKKTNPVVSSISKKWDKNDTISIIEFMPRLYDAYGNEDARYLTTLVDTVELNTNKSIREMSEFVGSSVSQTKMVYSFYKKGKEMTPLQYVHFLTDDLFQRKSLSNMVSSKQKSTLMQVAAIMDYADRDAHITASEIADVVTKYGMKNVTEDNVLAILNDKISEIQIVQDDLQDLSVKETLIDTDSDSIEYADINTSINSGTAQQGHIKTEEEIQEELIEELIYAGNRYTASQMSANFKLLGNEIDSSLVNLLYNYYGSQNDYNDSLLMSPEEMLTYVADTMVYDKRLSSFLTDDMRDGLFAIKDQISGSISMLSNDNHSLMVLITTLPAESDETYAFVEHLDSLSASQLEEPYYLIGESVMFNEMREGFNHEMTLVTLLTILAIFTIVAISFKSIIVPTILVITVMTAVYVNVIFSGIVSGKMLYLAYLIVQSILMGATIDYGILFANYYKEKRKNLSQLDANREAYRGAIGTITTSGLIMVLGAGIMAVLVEDVAISSIVGCLSIGAAVSILLILIVLPGTLVAFDKWVITEVGSKYNKNKQKAKGTDNIE